MSNNKAFKVKNGLDLGEYSKAISDTAVDVFVYDTSKDSDGGAWRKRTQGTSWYNETLNTATRGSRKEFPSVAVIVAETTQVTIYDGDDPDLPMWMVFNAGTHKLIGMATGGTPGSITCMTAYQGVIAIGIGAGSGRGLTTANLIAERAYYYSTGTSSRGFNGNIAERNDAKDDYDLPDIGPIVALEINDVAITVLPNAPIDAATGLPVPTIAVATDGGWSQISDDGNVYDFAFSTNPKVTNISFKNDTTIAWNGDSNLFTFDRGYFEAPLLTSDLTAQSVTTFNGSASYEYGATTETRYPNPIAGSTDTTNFSIPNAFGNINGLSLYDGLFENKVTSSGSTGMVAYAASDYATGWMNGAIKLATLSDTSTTNVTGAELVTNGTFASDISGWTNSDASSFTYDAGEARVTSSSGWQTVYQAITTVVGKTYVITADVTANSNIVDLWIGTAGTGALANRYALGGNSNITGTGPMSVTITATGTTTYVHLAVYSGTADFDNVTARLAEEDRSVNGNGLQVFGTVTKSAVATGADLVAYGPFTNANYLAQPHNSDLNFGTGDFCIMGWFKLDSNSGSSRIVYRQQDTSNRWTLYSNAANLWFYQTDGTATYSKTSGTHSLGVWNHIVVRRTNALTDFVLNGVIQANDASYAGTTARDATFTSPLYIGRDPNNSGTDNAWGGSLALIRISATIPSPEQIAKIYNDEKHLFQDGAQATLYGSSDAVTALAYDDNTELLHVGTSAGRSVFQGLRRVDNTTDAVGAAISASNGLVAED